MDYDLPRAMPVTFSRRFLVMNRFLSPGGLWIVCGAILFSATLGPAQAQGPSPFLHLPDRRCSTRIAHPAMPAPITWIALPT